MVVGFVTCEGLLVHVLVVWPLIGKRLGLLMLLSQVGLEIGVLALLFKPCVCVVSALVMVIPWLSVCCSGCYGHDYFMPPPVMRDDMWLIRVDSWLCIFAIQSLRSSCLRWRSLMPRRSVFTSDISFWICCCMCCWMSLWMVWMMVHWIPSSEKEESANYQYRCCKEGQNFHPWREWWSGAWMQCRWWWWCYKCWWW